MDSIALTAIKIGICVLATWIGLIATKWTRRPWIGWLAFLSVIMVFVGLFSALGLPFEMSTQDTVQ